MQTRILPTQFEQLGDLVSIDGSLVNAVLSMEWADYRGGTKKVKAHVGLDINRGIPTKTFLTDGKDYWIATSRYDLSVEDIAQVSKLRWNIETFFGWWKRNLKVYHLIVRSPYGLMVQIISGPITYLLLAIYCREEHGDKVSIHRARELHMQIANEVAQPQKNKKTLGKSKSRKRRRRPRKSLPDTT